jgi:predicted nucleotidyltransferase
MDKIVIKGRERKYRGILSNFFDLSIEKQEIFLNIKKSISEYFNKEIDVYIWGSHKHGFWDEQSDYDVIIYEMVDISEVQKKITEKLGVKVEINPMRKRLSEILIP